MGKGSKERSKERRQSRLQEISLLRTMSYSNQRWWTSETIAVVTGGNRGIGFEIIRQLAGHGMTVILTSRNTEVGTEAVKVLQEAGLLVEFHQLDIVDPQSIKEFADWIKLNHGGLDILVLISMLDQRILLNMQSRLLKQTIMARRILLKLCFL